MVLLTLISLLAALPAQARSSEVITTDWGGFQREISARDIEGQKVELTLIGGTKFKTKLISASDQALIVQATKSTAQWASRPKEAAIPKDQIRSVRVAEKMGHRGLFGSLLGFGAGAAIAAAIVSTSSDSCDESGCLMLISAASIPAVGAVAGYFTGRSMSPEGPEFVLTQ